jgi:hypothetical protein
VEKLLAHDSGRLDLRIPGPRRRVGDRERNRRER